MVTKICFFNIQIFSNQCSCTKHCCHGYKQHAGTATFQQLVSLESFLSFEENALSCFLLMCFLSSNYDECPMIKFHISHQFSVQRGVKLLCACLH